MLVELAGRRPEASRVRSPSRRSRWASGAEARLGTAAPGGGAVTATRSSPSSATTTCATAPAGTRRATWSTGGRSASVTMVLPSTTPSGSVPDARASRRAATVCSISGAGASRAPSTSTASATSSSPAPAPPTSSARAMPGAPAATSCCQSSAECPDPSCARTSALVLKRSAIDANRSTSAVCSSLSSRSTMSYITSHNARANLPGSARGRALGIGTPDAVALEHVDGDTLTYAELHAGPHVGAVIEALGVGAGDHVATLLPNTFDSHRALLALGWLRVVEVPLNTAYVGRMLAYTVDHSDATTLLTTSEYVDRVTDSGRHAKLERSRGRRRRRLPRRHRRRVARARRGPGRSTATSTRSCSRRARPGRRKR